MIQYAISSYYYNNVYLLFSAAIDVSSIMSVDSYVTKSGIKMVSTLHTNTMFLGKLKMGQGGVISAEYEMPEPRMDIISVK